MTGTQAEPSSVGQEHEVEGHQRAVEGAQPLEEAMVDHPVAADERERQSVSGQAGEEVEKFVIEFVLAAGWQVGNVDVQHQQRDCHRHDSVTEGDDPPEIGALHGLRKSGGADGSCGW